MLRINERRTKSFTNGNIVISLFIPGEGETVKCISLFMVHPEE